MTDFSKSQFSPFHWQTLVCLHVSYFSPGCHGFQVLGDIFRVLYFVSTMVLNLHLYSREIESADLSCHMLSGWCVIKFIDSEYAGPFGISEKAKALLGGKPTGTVVFYTSVCAPPISHLQLFKSWDFVRGSWFSIAHGQAFSWEEVIVLADKDFSPHPQCCRLSSCLHTQTTQIRFHS